MVNEIWKNRHKYGLEYCDLKTMLLNVSMLLRVVTVNIDGDYDKGIPIFYYIFALVTAFCYFYIFLFSMAWFVFWRCTITGEHVAAMIVLSLGISSEIGNLKLVYMCFYIDKIKQIVKGYLACDSQTIQGSRFQVNMLKTLRDVKKRAILYWMVLVGNGAAYLIKPALIPGRNFPENRFIFYGLEPMFESPNYEIAFLMMIGCMFFTCYVPASVSAYLIVITGYTEAQMRALSIELLNIWPDAVKKTADDKNLDKIDEFEINNRKTINKYVENHLKEIAKRHSLLISLFGQVNDVFRVAIAMGFVLLIIGLVSELLGGLKNTYVQIPFSYMQVTMDCFCGQRVIDANIIFEQAIYDCKWENFDRSNRKMVLVVLKNSQRTLTLSAGGITSLSFSCLMTITRAIYSSYTALRSAVK